jgi:ATP-binding cassette, subfamily B, bacterial IrtA/YbtP
MTKSRFAVFGWLLMNSKGHRARLFTSMGLSAVSAILAVVPMACIYLIAHKLFQAGDVAMDHVMYILVVAAVSVVLRSGAYLLAMICSHTSAYGLNFDLRGRIASHLALLPMGFFDRKASGAIKKVMLEDMENMEPFIAHYLPDLASAIVLQAASALLLLWIDPWLTLAALLPVPLAAVMHMGMNRVYRDNVAPFHDNMEAMNDIIVEYVRGMPVIKAFNRTASSFGQYRQTLERHLKIAESWSTRASRFSSFFWVCLDLGLVFILPTGFWMYTSGRVDGAELVLFLLLGTGIMEPVGRIIMITGLLDRIGEGIRRIENLLEQSPLTAPKNPASPKGHAIEFCRVSFRYGENDVLTDLSFTLPEGSVTGLVGPSGAGKSTAARLVARFWDVRRGRILIGGVDIREIPANKLMKHIAFVFQDIYLMNDTIMENIRMGNPDAVDEAVIKAAKSAAAHDFIMALENGYQTQAGEGGAHLSGGEKQRIAIARAILKDAPILILDEITSATDPENERRIHTALNRLMTGKTVLVIAHKLPSVMRADQLLLFESGRLRAKGTHDELLTDELYRTLWERSTKAGSWKLALEEEGNDI